MARRTKGSADELLTLTEVANRTGISMPTLQRYKKLYQARIPSVGKGRKQRYPASSLAVFDEIKTENIGKRGRPRKTPAAAKPSRQAPKASARKAASARRPKASARKAKAAPAKAESLLTLTEISRRTGISYPTLTRYVKKYGRQLKSEGTGRARRFYEEAVAVFSSLRANSRRGGGRKKAAAPAKAAPRGRRPRASAANVETDTAALVARITALEKQLKVLERKLKRPIRLQVLER